MCDSFQNIYEYRLMRNAGVLRLPFYVICIRNVYHRVNLHLWFNINVDAFVFSLYRYIAVPELPMESRIGLDYIVENVDYTAKLAKGKFTTNLSS